MLGHDHSHDHGPQAFSTARTFALVTLLNLGFTVVEAIWGGRTWVLLSAIATLALIAWAGAALRRKWSARKE